VTEFGIDDPVRGQRKRELTSAIHILRSVQTLVDFGEIRLDGVRFGGLSGTVAFAAHLAGIGLAVFAGIALLARVALFLVHEVFEAENNLRIALIRGLKEHTLNSSPIIVTLDNQLVRKSRILSSSLDEENWQLKDLEDAATTSISEYDRRYNVLGIKILSALLFVIIGSATLLANFLRERNHKLAKARLYRGFAS
jgi:hypothetical protein